MFTKQSLLDNVRIAKPCPARWADMEGDDRMRFCQLCKLNVYDTSQMSSEEAESLIRETSGRLCLRLHKRADGRIITSDCPVGLSAMRKRILYMVAGAAAIALAAMSKASTLWISGESPEESTFGQMVAKSKETILATGIFGKPTPKPVPAPTYIVMGDIAAPPPPYHPWKSPISRKPKTAVVPASAHSTTP